MSGIFLFVDQVDEEDQYQSFAWGIWIQMPSYVGRIGSMLFLSEADAKDEALKMLDGLKAGGFRD